MTQYDAFFIDLWGVVHDGTAPFVGAIHALQQLRAAGKKVILLSNSSDSQARAILRQQHYGIVPDLYDVLITSGELVGQALSRDPTLWLPGKPHLIYMVGDSHLLKQYANPALRSVSDPTAAGLVLNGWYGATVLESETWIPQLQRWRDIELPMVCMNPDIDVMHQASRTACPGALAAVYGRLGGNVHYYGKPYRPAFQAAWAAAALHADARVAMIGDNLLTDIRGGNNFGIDTILVTGGVHRDFLGKPWGHLPASDRLEALWAAHNLKPTAIIGNLVF